MNTKVFGNIEQEAINQLETCLEHPNAVAGCIMPDGHVGYSMPIGGVIAYKDAVSPSGVGFDIACGNKAVRLDIEYATVQDNIDEIMDEIFHQIAFGVGGGNGEFQDDPIFDHPAWGVEPFKSLHQVAGRQLGSVGAGNHYIDIFVERFRDEQPQIWAGVHCGSRKLGHSIASGYLNLAHGGEFNDRWHDEIYAPATVLDIHSGLGADYWFAMEVAGVYAYRSRDLILQKVADIIGTEIVEEVHNHHNFAWEETIDPYGDVIVVRKGATPAYNGQRGFVGATMAEESVILVGLGNPDTLCSTVHGAGRVISRSKAKGKKGRPGLVSWDETTKQMNDMGVVLRGGAVDESPECYKRLDEVLDFMVDNVIVTHYLKPLGVAMAKPRRRR